jgi:hypothetical protein
MNNHAVLETALKSRWLVLRLAAEDLRALAAWVAQPGPAHALQAIYAVTLIGRTTLPLGFVLRPRPAGLRNRLDRFFLTGLLALYSGEGLDRLAHGLAPHSDPEEIWMSRAELMRRYAKPSE